MYNPRGQWELTITRPLNMYHAHIDHGFAKSCGNGIICEGVTLAVIRTDYYCFKLEIT